MPKLTITAESRKVLGKKVKKMRAEGVLPANLFGKDIKSHSLQLLEKDFRKLFKEAGETTVVEVKVKDKIYPALIHSVQKHPVTGKTLHVDFHKVNLKEKITANVPLKLIGESPAEKSGVGLILQTINEIEVESLPTDIPTQIEIDATKLAEVGQTIHVKNLKIDRDKVDVKNDPEDVVVSVQIAEMKEEAVEKEAPSPEDVEATAEKDKDEETEGGEKPIEDKSSSRAQAEGKESTDESKGDQDSSEKK